MHFTVEVPVYLKVAVNAPDRNTAIKLAEDTVSQLSELPIVDSTFNAYILPLHPEEEDREPDVYVCRGGELAALLGDDVLIPLDEKC